MSEQYFVGKKEGSCDDLCGSCPILRKVKCILSGRNSTRFGLYHVDGYKYQLFSSRTMDGIGSNLANRLKGEKQDLENVDYHEGIAEPHRVRIVVGFLSSNGY